MSSFNTDYIGSVAAQIYVGLGGVGGRAVQRIYRRLHQDKTWARYKSPCTGFLVVDTNKGDLDQYSEERGIKGIHTARTDRQTILNQRLEGRDHFLSHFVPNGYEPRNTSEGAGQIRLESRVGFYLYSDVIQSAIENAVNSIIRTENAYLRPERVVDVFVFCSLAGGTGSGCFLPFAYLAREVIKERGWSPKLHGHIMTSEALEASVKRELHSFINANAYAALKELDHVNKSSCEGGRPVEFVYRRPRSPDEPITTVRRPFDTVFLVDEPASADLDEKVERAMADAAYINVMTPVGVSVSGEADNYSRFLKTQIYVSENSNTLTESGFSKNYSTHGSAALVCPTEAIIDYCATRFVSELLREQLAAAGDQGAGLVKDRELWESIPQSDRERILNKQWYDAITERAEDETKKLKERAQRIEQEFGISLSEDSKGYLQEMIDRVCGESSQTDEEFGEDNDPWGSDDEETAVEGSLLSQLSTAIDRSIESAGYTPLRPVKFGAQQLQSISAQLTEIEQKAGASSKENLTRLGRLERKGKNLDLIGELQVDATTERFLILTLLLQGHLDKWISAAKEAVTGRENASFYADEKTLKGVREKVDALQQSMYELRSRGTVTSLWEDTFGTSAEELQTDVQQQADEIFNNRIRATNEVNEAKLKLALLEAMRQACKLRARSYVKVGEQALQRSRDLETQASRQQETTSEKQMGAYDFCLRVEALNSLDADHLGRLWNIYWEDTCRPLLNSVRDDRKWLGETVNEAFQTEEKRAESEKTTLDERRILKSLEDKFREKALERLRGALLDDDESGLTLDRALELEAIYSTMDRSREGRGGRVNEFQKILADKSHPDNKVHRDKVGQYLKKKMSFVVGKADILARLDLPRLRNRSDVTPFISNILVGHVEVLEKLMGKYPEIREALSSDDGLDTMQEYAGQGLQRWTDRNSMMVYKIVGILPLFIFERIGRLHGHYSSVMALGDKMPNPIHSDSRWERGLPNLDPVSQKNEREWDQLANCLVSGIVYHHQAAWRLRIGQERLLICGEVGDLHREFVAKVKEKQLASFIDAELKNTQVNTERRGKLVKQFEKIIKTESLEGRPNSPLVRLLTRLNSEMQEANW